MIVNGIIAEYNPFHNGHEKHIRLSKEKTGADYTIVVISSNFVQRGAPALIDKFARAKMALLGGADLVIELPAIYSISSAEYFAMGGVTILDKLGCVDYLSFGTEAQNLDNITKLATILANEPDEYKVYLKRNLRDGMSFPVARNAALIQYDPSLYDASTILASPNNILAIEYVKALQRRKSSIRPISIFREGSQYHDRMIPDSCSFTSSQAIREAIFRSSSEPLDTVMPAAAYEVLKSELEAGRFLDSEDISEMIYYKLLQEKNIGYNDYFDVSPDLSDKIIKALPNFIGVREFCDELKSKDLTYSRVGRAIMHILLDIKDTDVQKVTMQDYVPYARILGFRKESEDLLTQLKINSRIPLISKLPDAKKKLMSEGYHMLQREMQINSIYTGAMSIKSKQVIADECSTPIVIV